MDETKKRTCWLCQQDAALELCDQSATPFFFRNDTPWCIRACSSCNIALWNHKESHINTLLNLAADAHAMDGVWDGG